MSPSTPASPMSYASCSGTLHLQNAQALHPGLPPPWSSPSPPLLGIVPVSHLAAPLLLLAPINFSQHSERIPKLALQAHLFLSKGLSPFSGT